MEFTFFWLNGTREVGSGTTVMKALKSLGHDRESLNDLDFYMPGDNHNYTYNTITKAWLRKPTELEALITRMDSGFYIP